MRIRKRQVPLPLSSLSPVPLSSDPYSNGSPVVQLHPNRNLPQNPTQQPDHSGPQPSDQPNQPIGTVDDADEVQNFKMKKMESSVLTEEEDTGRDGGEGERSNDTREKNIILGAEMGTGGILSQSSSSRQEVRRWCEGEKAIPLKKRRGSFGRKMNEETTSTTAAVVEKIDYGNKKVTKMKTKMNKKLNDVVKESGNNKRRGGNNKNKGGAIMEGSRCSRVNGRGWRCCQQTLVGYSLCEHHLGKGRLRSISSVRSRSFLGSSSTTTAAAAAATTPANTSNNETKPFSSSNSFQESKTVVEDVDGEKPLMRTTATKKRMKLGMVKARSISSLLGQTTTEEVAIVADNYIIN